MAMPLYIYSSKLHKDKVGVEDTTEHLWNELECRQLRPPQWKSVSDLTNVLMTESQHTKDLVDINHGFVMGTYWCDDQVLLFCFFCPYTSVHIHVSGAAIEPRMQIFSEQYVLCPQD